MENNNMKVYVLTELINDLTYQFAFESHKDAILKMFELWSNEIIRYKKESLVSVNYNREEGIASVDHGNNFIVKWYIREVTINKEGE